MNRINFYITERQEVGLEKIVKYTGTSVSEHLRRALDAYLKEQFKQAIEGGLDSFDLVKLKDKEEIEAWL